MPDNVTPLRLPTPTDLASLEYAHRLLDPLLVTQADESPGEYTVEESATIPVAAPLHPVVWFLTGTIAGMLALIGFVSIGAAIQ